MDSAGMTVLVEYGLRRHDSLGGIGCTQMEVEAADRDIHCAPLVSVVNGYMKYCYSVIRLAWQHLLSV